MTENTEEFGHKILRLKVGQSFTIDTSDGRVRVEVVDKQPPDRSTEVRVSAPKSVPVSNALDETETDSA